MSNYATTLPPIRTLKVAFAALVLAFLAACGDTQVGQTAPPTVQSSPAEAGPDTGSTQSSTVTLTWDPSPASENVAGYRLYYGTSPGRYLQQFGNGIPVGNIASHKLSGLLAGTAYYFAVTAYSAAGAESGFSIEVQKVAP